MTGSSTKNNPKGAGRLTDRQREALDIIRTFIDKEGYPPTVRELADTMGISGPKGAKEYMDILERKGYIERVHQSPRALKIVDLKPGDTGAASEGVEIEGATRPPLWLRDIPVIGRVAAGEPITAVENIEGYFSPDNRKDDLFMLRVRGESMIDVHIAPGDMVLVRPQQHAESGDIVVALLNGEATVKRYKMGSGRGPEGAGAMLFPENRDMKPIVVEGEDDFSIVGKVVGVVRDMEGDLVVPE
ncbi:MAG: transcriptional repressor LexA [Deltaproteobacteria bacterium]|uniref:LexA repressor n=1 Tax=Candidatus Zymogenus saltonus TaxID=2844893 RepID=A0A9D8PPZ4_9DELT|nr:transcriptional repressor LexA [Candidatus Zymogenus saltonus]